jgi:hypothetical protein
MKTKLFASLLLLSSFSLIAQDAVNLKFNFKTGNKYKVKTTSEQSIATSMNGMQQTMSTSNISYMSLVPLALGQKSISCDITFDSIQTSTSGAMSIKINSNKPGDIKSSNMNDVMNEITSRLCKSHFKVILSYDGKVIAINNIKEVNDAVTKGLDSLTGQFAPMIKMQANMMISETTIKGMIEANTAYLPSKPVKIGDPWNTQYVQSAGGVGFTVATNYKLDSKNGEIAEISGNATLEPAGTAPMEINGGKMSYDVRGLSVGNLKVNTTTGWIITNNSKSHMKGNMNISMNGNEMSIPVEIDSKSEAIAIQ